MEHTLEIIGTVVGILYLWLEYRASIYLWIAGIIMPAVYIFVYYDAGLYADFGINIYYLGAAIYGWMMCSAWHCLDIDKLHGQQCALAGLLHHRTEHSRHVDAGTEICRAMVGMDCGRCR